MRRATILLLLSGLAAPTEGIAPASGQVATAPAAPVTKGFTLSADGWVARVNPPGPDDHGNLQRAHDALAARVAVELKRNYMAHPTPVLAIPDGEYTLGRPLWIDCPFLKVRGVGEGSWLHTSALESTPVLVIGIPRAKPAVAASHRTPTRIDATGGTRSAFSTRSHGRLWAPGTPFGLGQVTKESVPDHFGSTRCLTLSAAFAFSGGLPRGQSLLGVGRWDGEATPYFLGVPDPGDGPDRYRAKFGVVDGKGVHSQLVVELPATGSDIAEWQVDLDAGRASGWVGGVQVASQPIPKGLSFVANESMPFVVNDRGGYTPVLAGARQVDFTLGGLSMSVKPRYVDGGVGSKQVRIDRKPITNAYRLFASDQDDPGLLAHLELHDAEPAEFRIRGGPMASSRWTRAHLLRDDTFADGGNTFGPGSIEVSGLRISGQGFYGATMILGPSGNFHANGLNSEGGAYGYAGLNGPTYQSVYRDCWFSGSDAAILSLLEMASFVEPRFPTAGRCTVRLWASKFDLEGGFVQHHSPDSAHFLKSHSAVDGGQVAIRRLSIDFEGSTYSGSPFVMEGNQGRSNRFKLAEINAGTMGASPLVRLTSPPNSPGGTASIEGFTAIDGPPGRPAIKADAGWSGHVSGGSSGGRADTSVDSPRMSDWTMPTANPERTPAQAGGPR